jgi:hypothetical protein
VISVFFESAVDFSLRFRYTPDSDAVSVALKYLPFVAVAMFVRRSSSRAVATLKPLICRTVPAVVPMPIG